METHEFRIEYKKHRDWISIVPLGDLHLGNKNCDLKYFKNMVEWIKNNDYAYTILMGDMCDFIAPRDPRYDQKTIDMDYITPEKQINEIEKIIKPLADQNKIIGAHLGNHEETMRRNNYYDFSLNLCYDLGIKYLGHSALTKLKFQRMSKDYRSSRRNFVMYSCHGHGGGRTIGSKANKLKEFAHFIDADIYLMAHHHQLVAFRDIQFKLSPKNKLVERKRVFACTGSFLRGHSTSNTSYAEKKGYPPIKIGAVKLMVQPEVKDLHISQ